uniref:Glycolipid transfer protein domain-containing protein n=1 Tax=Oryza nivara TaxID=4536 RepID=A0A0E0G9V0_ORYNI
MRTREMAETVFTPSLEGMKHVKSESSVILTKPFLDVCKQILPVLDKFGAAMALVKSDIGGNITRLENKYSSDPSKYEQLYSMVQEEVQNKTAKVIYALLVNTYKSTSVHNWVAMKLAPNREKFMEVISGTGDIKADIEKFCTTFYPFLKENHDFLASVGLDDLKAS